MDKVSECVGKTAYETWDEAADQADKISVHHQMRVYKCSTCSKHHLASVNRDANPRWGWHKPCGGTVKVIHRKGKRFCGRCLKKLIT